MQSVDKRHYTKVIVELSQIECLGLKAHKEYAFQVEIPEEIASSKECKKFLTETFTLGSVKG
jgi:hypothetical protein